MITDTHTHLYSERFDEDRDAMIQRAIAAQVTRFFIPAIDSNYTQSMYDLESKYPDNVYLMMGLHPTHVKPGDWHQELQHVEEELRKRKFVAIGEIGIDLYWDQSTLEIQQQVFEQQIIWAKQYELPIVIHCRDAFDEVFEVLEKHQGSDLFGVFHCFTGSLDQAKRAIELGMSLGIGGVVTFKNGKIDQFLHEIAIENIVLETDAPYLSPTPYRGKRNESSYITRVVTRVSEIYQLPEEQIATMTTNNSKRIFGV